VHSTSSFPLSSIAVTSWLRSGPAAPRRGGAPRARAHRSCLPARIGDLAGFIGGFRKAMHERIPEFSLRRRFWERVIDGPIGALVLAGRKDEAAKALQEIADPSAFAGATEAGNAEGRVTLVGAGPGDPDLLTIKALRALQDADVVFYDETGVARNSRPRPPRRRARSGRSPRRQARHRPGCDPQALDRCGQIRPARGAAQGGDPFIFGRGGEEIEALRAAGVAYSVVPGITAGLGAAAQFEAPLTYRHEGPAHHLPHRAQGARRRDRRLVGADGQEDDHRRLYGH